MQRLTGLDATFLYLETPNNHMHVAGAAIFDPSTVPEGYSFDAVKDLVESRLHLLPPFRRRLVTVPFDLHHPLWIEDPDFDIEYHVRRAALPSPGGLEELAEFTADVISRPLDRTKALWEMYLIEGLEGGFVAAVTKTHHAAIDGVSGAELTVNLLDLTPEPAAVPPPEEQWRPDRIPTDFELVGYAVNSLARQPLRALKTIRRTAEVALTLRRRNRQPDVKPPPGLFSAPRTPFNVSLTPHRKAAFKSVALEDFKRVKNAFGTTVNDVVLAVCAGALRRYLLSRGELPDDPLVAMVPISVRSEDQAGTLGNRVSSMLVSLATDIDDPVERLLTINGGTREAKEQHNAIGAETLSDWAEFAAPAVAARAARLASRMRVAERMKPIFNVTISNVPGPPFPLYSAGARMVANYPLGPVNDGVGLNMTVMSYMESMDFGLTACSEVMPDLWDLAHAIGEALDELVKAAADTEAPEPAVPPAPDAKPATRKTPAKAGGTV